MRSRKPRCTGVYPAAALACAVAVAIGLESPAVAVASNPSPAPTSALVDSSLPITASSPPPAAYSGDPQFATGPALVVRAPAFVPAQAAIEQTIRRHIAQVRWCYTRSISIRPDLEGTTVVRFVVGRDGLVTLTQNVYSTMPEPSVDDCVQGAIRQWHFPESPEGIVLATRRFVFRRDCYHFLPPRVHGMAPRVHPVQSDRCRSLR